MTPELLTAISAELPAGCLVVSEEGDGEDRPLWLSGGPASAEHWCRLHSQHGAAGLWPLLLDSYELVHLRDPAFFPMVAVRPTAGAAISAADAYAEVYLGLHPRARLGLVAAESGAHALAAAGWQGPLNYDNDTGKFAAVVASWQERFGARVVAVGGDTLELSVAAPPSSRADVLAVASEHFAFCPDNIWQGSHPHTIAAYAERLIDAPAWTFWWD